MTVHNYYDDYYAKPNLKLKDVFEKFDFDTVTPQTLARFPYVITTRGAFASGPPPWTASREDDPQLHPLEARAAMVSVDRHVLNEGDAPGAMLRCPSGGASRSGSSDGLPAPPVTSSDWNGGPTVEDGAPATTSVNLPPGRWDVSLQYDATRPVHLTAPGLDATIPANLDYRGTTPYYAAGIIDAPGGPVTVTVSVEQPPLAGRLLGAKSEAHLGSIAFTRVALIVRARGRAGRGRRDPGGGRACGRYVDWYSRR